MPRAPRVLPPNTPAHIVQRAVDRQTIFREAADFDHFMSLLGFAVARYEVSLFGYCLMPNHWHLMVQGGRRDSISHCMRWLTGTHALRHRILNNTVGLGHVYQGRFWSRPCSSETHFYNVLRYIEANPARAGLVEKAQDWPWSSGFERQSGERAFLTDLPLSLPSNWFDLLNPGGTSPPQE